MAPNPMHPCECAPPLVQAAVPLESVATMTKQQLLLNQFLQPPDASNSEASDKPGKPSISGSNCGSNPDGLVSGSAGGQEPRGRNAQPSHNAQQVASLFDDGKTTVMLRNIPNRYSCEELLNEVMLAGFEGKFDSRSNQGEMVDISMSGVSYGMLKNP